jgi:hypothetical protein
MKNYNTFTEILISKIWAHMTQFENEGLAPKEIMRNYFYWRKHFPQEIVDLAIIKKWPQLIRLLEWYKNHYDPTKRDYSPFKNLPMR